MIGYRTLVIILAVVAVIETVLLAVESLLIPTATCSRSLGSNLMVLVAIGLLMLVITALGTMWRAFVGRRLQRYGATRLDRLRASSPAAAKRVDQIEFRLFVRLPRLRTLGDAMVTHPWLTGLSAGLSAIVIFGAIFAIGGWLEPNSCG